MIRVTVEIFPGGYAENRRTIGLMDIANLSDLARRSDYKIDVAESARTVYLRNHDRNQSVWRPLAAALAAAEK
jgi:hypothetical protein